MAIFDLFSKRQKREKGDVPDVWKYDEVPHPLRVQIVHIWNETIGRANSYGASDVYTFIRRTLCKEYGLFRLGEVDDDHAQVVNFLLKCEYTDRVLDVVELSFKIINCNVRENPDRFIASTKPDEAIAELNQRFKEHGVGYRFESGQLIRIDSQFVHSQIVKPALELLSDKRFKGANEEFLTAHEHYRHRKHKECLNECLKAFESVMKTLCKLRRWSYDKHDSAKKLIDICYSNGLIPPYLQSYFAALRSTLESGVPTVRSKLGAHGQGAKIVKVPEHFASYCLHQSAAAILFLVESEKRLP